MSFASHAHNLRRGEFSFYPLLAIKFDFAGRLPQFLLPVDLLREEFGEQIVVVWLELFHVRLGMTFGI